MEALFYGCYTIGIIGMAINSFLYVKRLTEIEKSLWELRSQLESMSQLLQ